LRVHGDKVIRRREGVPKLKYYQDGREQLEQDFHYLSGYCGTDDKNHEVVWLLWKRWKCTTSKIPFGPFRSEESG